MICLVETDKSTWIEAEYARETTEASAWVRGDMVALSVYQSQGGLPIWVYLSLSLSFSSFQSVSIKVCCDSESIECSQFSDSYLFYSVLYVSSISFAWNKEEVMLYVKERSYLI